MQIASLKEVTQREKAIYVTGKTAQITAGNYKI